MLALMFLCIESVFIIDGRGFLRLQYGCCGQAFQVRESSRASSAVGAARVDY
jgi:hypothetical protein